MARHREHTSAVTKDSVDSLSDQIYGVIKEDILTGVFLPRHMMQEGRLAKRFGTSKTPVREALLRLVREGLLDVYPRVGYAVTEVSIDDIESLFEYRAILEASAAELAAVRMTPGQLERLEMVMETPYLVGERESYHDFFAQNQEFHLQIAGASGNRHLAQAIASLFDQIDRVLRYRLDIGDSAERMEREHGAVIEALARRDGAEARRITEASIQKSKEQIIRGLLREKVSQPRAPALRRTALRDDTTGERVREVNEDG